MRITRDERNFYDELLEDDDDAPEQEIATAFANATDALTCALFVAVMMVVAAACMAWC